MRVLAAEFTRFVIVGAINTIVTYGLFLVIQRHINYMVAYTIVFAFGIVLSYTLNVLFVFTGRHSIGAVVKFPSVYIAQYLYGAAALPLLIEYAGLAHEIAMLIVIATSVLLTFVLMKLVFGRPAPADKLTDSTKHS